MIKNVKIDENYLLVSKQVNNENVVVLDVMDSASFSNFFKWLSSSVASGSSSLGLAGQNSLPPPPPEIQLVM